MVGTGGHRSIHYTRDEIWDSLPEFYCASHLHRHRRHTLTEHRSLPSPPRDRCNEDEELTVTDEPRRSQVVTEVDEFSVTQETEDRVQD